MRKKISLSIVALFLVLALLPALAEGAVHTVQRGDTLWNISRRYQTTVAELAATNNLRNTHIIYVGQALNLPGGSTVPYTVRRGDTMWNISQRHGITLNALVAANSIPSPSYIEVSQVLRIPVSGGGNNSSSVGGVTPPSRSRANLSASELDLFARLVFSEAAGEPFTGQVAVAASVLNRKDSSIYPNTLSGVVYQVVGGYYQYSPVLDGRINLPANDSARRAVREALAGADPSLGATGFYNPAKTSNQWVRSQPVTTRIGNHVFFR